MNVRLHEIPENSFAALVSLLFHYQNYMYHMIYYCTITVSTNLSMSLNRVVKLFPKFSDKFSKKMFITSSFNAISDLSASSNFE